MDKPTKRALIVYETLLSGGPQTLNQLTACLHDISRMGIHRALTHLREQGWVRMRWGDNAWHATPRLRDFVGHAPPPPRLPADVDLALPPPPNGVDIAVGHFAEQGQFDMIEATGPLASMAADNLLRDTLPQVVLAAIDPALAVRHIQAWLPGATASAQKQVSSGQLNRHIKQARQDLCIWSDLTCAFAFQSADGKMGGVLGVARTAAAQAGLKAWVQACIGPKDMRLNPPAFDGPAGDALDDLITNCPYRDCLYFDIAALSGHDCRLVSSTDPNRSAQTLDWAADPLGLATLLAMPATSQLRILTQNKNPDNPDQIGDTTFQSVVAALKTAGQTMRVMSPGGCGMAVPLAVNGTHPHALGLRLRPAHHFKPEILHMVMDYLRGFGTGHAVAPLCQVGQTNPGP